MWSYTICPTVLTTVCDKAVLAGASAIMLPTSFSFWAMDQDKWHVGREFGGHGYMRLQLKGYRTVICVPNEAMTTFLSEGVPAASDGQTNIAMDYDAIDSWLESAEGKKMEKLLGMDGVQHATIGPNMLCSIPSGYTVLEKTLGLVSYGVKRVLVTKDRAPRLVLKAFLEAQPAPPKGPLVCLSIVENALGTSGGEVC